ncbi:TetR/AcrR family transcriptional regulator [Mesorhizobium sp. CAU 1741]|uniref:TetR/AcrR family transcriptional regulator n=1 Tax=Mesorhizobium sp. CAU 1741 TaxID=3140366 RepID=UPI00325A8A80
MPKPISEIRKPEIIDAAFAAIKKHGLPMPSYDQIASEAGMSRQLIRHYFPTIESLLVALGDALAAKYRELLMRGILDANVTERLPMFLDFYFDFLSGKGLGKPADDAVYDALFSLSVASEPIRKNLHDQYSLLQWTIAHEVQISNPGLSQNACREIGFLFVSLMYGHWKMVATLGFSGDYHKVTRAALDRILASYNAHYEDPDLK